jgi:hypothetical protein
MRHCRIHQFIELLLRPQVRNFAGDIFMLHVHVFTAIKTRVLIICSSHASLQKKFGV